MSKVSNFTEGKILSPLLKFIIPILAALFLQTMYGAVDLLIVGRFCNAADYHSCNYWAYYGYYNTNRPKTW